MKLFATISLVGLLAGFAALAEPPKPVQQSFVARCALVTVERVKAVSTPWSAREQGKTAYSQFLSTPVLAHPKVMRRT